MKLNRFFAITLIAVSGSLYSCGCEDVNLGKLEFSNELISFLPAQPVQGKSYYIASNGTKQKLNYVNADGIRSVEIPVSKTNYNGKFDPNSCKEFYTADQKVYKSQIEGENPLSITVTYRKDASTERYNNIVDKDAVGDVVEFVVEFNNTFPTPITMGSTTISNYKTMRTLLFNDATTNPVDNHSYKQEFIPTVTLNGLQYTNVYHLYFSEPTHYRPEEQYIVERYPALDYIKGIYIKEGSGIIHAYSYQGKNIAISVE